MMSSESLFSMIIDENDDYIVLNKPPHVLVHPTKPSDKKTIWNFLNEFLAYELSVGGQISFINRLDRETTGLLLVAKNKQAARIAGINMEKRRIKKEYHAIINGWPKKDCWRINLPIIRQNQITDSAIWLKRTVHPRGEEAMTDFILDKRLLHPQYGYLSLIRCIPYTGRTHQIRVHLHYSGYPILGDKIYGCSEKLYIEFIETGWTKKLEQELKIPHHALHSSRLIMNSSENTDFNWFAQLHPNISRIITESSDKV